MKFDINKWLTDNDEYIDKVLTCNIKYSNYYEDIKQDAILFCIQRAKYFKPDLGHSYKSYIHVALKRYVKLMNNKYKDSIHRTNQLYEYYPQITSILLGKDGCLNTEITSEDIHKIYPQLALSEIKEIIRMLTCDNRQCSIDTGVIDTLQSEKSNPEYIDKKIDLDLELKQRVLDIKTLNIRSRAEVLRYINHVLCYNDRNVCEFIRKDIGKDNDTYKERMYGNLKKVKRATAFRHQIESGFYNGKYLLTHSINDILKDSIRRIINNG